MKRLGRRGVTHRVDRDRCQAVARRYRHGPKAGLGKRRFRRQASPLKTASPTPVSTAPICPNRPMPLRGKTRRSQQSSFRVPDGQSRLKRAVALTLKNPTMLSSPTRCSRSPTFPVLGLDAASDGTF